jgi:hypothetical protein
MPTMSEAVKQAMNNPESHLHYLLCAADPDVWRQVVRLEANFPELNGRALRAGIMAAAHAVKEGTDPLNPSVESSRGSKTLYTVSLQNPKNLKGASCTCPDFAKAGTGRGAPILHGVPTCKHMLAVWISYKIYPPIIKKETPADVSTEVPITSGDANHDPDSTTARRLQQANAALLALS